MLNFFSLLFFNKIQEILNEKMVRVKRGNVALKRRKKTLKMAKGYRGKNSKLSTFAGEQVIQSLNFAYVGRRLKKRAMRRFWIHRINAASRLRKNIYSRFIGSLRKLDVLIDRKMLSMIAFCDFPSFSFLERTSRNAMY